MIELHLKDGRTIRCEGEVGEFRFAHGESGRRVEKKIGEDWITVVDVTADAFAFFIVTDHATLNGEAHAPEVVDGE
jgi:hypothetical protein